MLTVGWTWQTHSEHNYILNLSRCSSNLSMHDKQTGGIFSQFCLQSWEPAAMKWWKVMFTLCDVGKMWNLPAKQGRCAKQFVNSLASSDFVCSFLLCDKQELSFQKCHNIKANQSLHECHWNEGILLKPKRNSGKNEESQFWQKHIQRRK